MDFLTIMETTEADVPEGQVSSVPTVAATVTVDHRHSFRPLLRRRWMNLVTELCILYFAVPSPSRPRCTSSRNVTVADLLAGANLNEAKHENVTAYPANPLFKGSGRDFREPKKKMYGFQGAFIDHVERSYRKDMWPIHGTSLFFMHPQH